jgi:hypothetical protein
MSYGLGLVLAVVGALAAGLPLIAKTPAAQATKTTKTENVKFAPGGTIRLRDSFGSLTVEGWDRPEVEVTVVKSLGFVSDSEQRSNQRLDDVHVVTERKSDTELEISTSAPSTGFLGHLWLKGHDAAVEYRIRAPRNSHLEINHAGYISIAGMTGDINATDRRGDIVLMLPDLAAYSIDAHTKAGLVMSDVAATTHKKHLVGENLSHGDATVPHKLVLRMGFGGITIKQLPPEAVTPPQPEPK